MEKRQLKFITGGARSGKSSFAENYAIALAKNEGGHLQYIASSYCTDEEMATRIQLHQQQREASGAIWQTWECPLHIGKIAPSFQNNDIVLLDCLTILLANQLFQGSEDSWKDDEFQREVFQSIVAGIDAIRERAHTLIVVSNEVSHEPLDDPLVHTYMRILGRLHQQIVERACKAYVVEASIPLLMKEL